MTIPNCGDNWHVFEGGLPKVGQVCKCGKVFAIDKIGTARPVSSRDHKPNGRKRKPKP